MHHLVLFRDKTVAICRDEEIKPYKEGIKAKWGKRFYCAEIILSHEDREILEKVEVDQKGRIVAGLDEIDKNSNEQAENLETVNFARNFEDVDPDRLADVQENFAVPAENVQIENIDDNLDFDNSAGLDGLQKNNDLTDGNLETEEESEILEIDNSGGEQVYENANGRNYIPGQQEIENHEEQQMHNVPDEDIDEIAAVVQVNQDELIQGPHTNDIAARVMEKLHPNHDVYLERDDILELTMKYREDANSLVHESMIKVIGRENLASMSPTGGGGWETIPRNILLAVFGFVNDTVEQPLKWKVYRTVLTKFCNRLRHA